MVREARQPGDVGIVNMTNANDPVWGVIIMIAIGLVGTCWVIYKILGDED